MDVEIYGVYGNLSEIFMIPLSSNLNEVFWVGTVVVWYKSSSFM